MTTRNEIEGLMPIDEAMQLIVSRVSGLMGYELSASRNEEYGGYSLIIPSSVKFLHEDGRSYHIPLQVAIREGELQKFVAIKSIDGVVDMLVKWAVK